MFTHTQSVRRNVQKWVHVKNQPVERHPQTMLQPAILNIYPATLQE